MPPSLDEAPPSYEQLPPRYTPPLGAPPPYSPPTSSYLRQQTEIESMVPFSYPAMASPAHGYCNRLRRLFLMTLQDSICTRLLRFTGFTAITGTVASGLGAGIGSAFSFIPQLGTITFTTLYGAGCGGLVGVAAGGYLSFLEYRNNPERYNDSGVDGDLIVTDDDEPGMDNLGYENDLTAVVSTTPDPEAIFEDSHVNLVIAGVPPV